MDVTRVTSLDQLRKLTGHGTVMIMFSAPWCQSSHLISAYFEVLAKRYQRVKFLKINVEEIEDVSGQMGVNSTPTFQLLVDSELVEELEGTNEAQLDEVLSKYN